MQPARIRGLLYKNRDKIDHFGAIFVQQAPERLQSSVVLEDKELEMGDKHTEQKNQNQTLSEERGLSVWRWVSTLAE